MIYFARMLPRHLPQVLEWRTQPEVTRYMFTDVEPDFEQHKRWYETIAQSPKDRYWMVGIKDRWCGVISLNDLDRLAGTSGWGYYIGDRERRMYGGLVPPYLYNYVFHCLKLDKLTAEVMVDNEGVLKLHRLHGYTETEICKAAIVKNGRPCDVAKLELSREAWLGKATMYDKYRADFGD